MRPATYLCARGGINSSHNPVGTDACDSQVLSEFGRDVPAPSSGHTNEGEIPTRRNWGCWHLQVPVRGELNGLFGE